MFRYQPPSSKHTSHFSFSGRLGDSQTYFNLGELPFYFTTIWIWENPKKDFVWFFWTCRKILGTNKKKSHFYFGCFGWTNSRFFLRLKKWIQCQGPRNQIWILFHPDSPDSPETSSTPKRLPGKNQRAGT